MIVNMTSKNMYQDESGQWWWVDSRGDRKRCYEQTCHKCGEVFVARALGAKTPTHCSRTCSMACRKDDSDCNRIAPKRKANIDGLILASDQMYKDADGQWWVPRNQGQRARCTPAICHHCGAGFVPYPTGKNVKLHCTSQCYSDCRVAGNHGSPTRARRGEDSHHWKGGRITRKGYVLIFRPDHHSIAGRGTGRKYVFEHRLVMEEMLGRPLKSNETVHHKNGITDDNRPENLELWGYQPPGQRVGEGKHCVTCTCESHV